MRSIDELIKALECNIDEYSECENCPYKPWGQCSFIREADAIYYLEKYRSDGRKNGKWNFIGDNMFECTCCGESYSLEQLSGYRNRKSDPIFPKYCPKCGAEMEKYQ